MNLLRKLYHTRLHQLASQGETLLAMLRIVDGHSASIAKKHYILRGPADDAKLAEHLVHALLGDTVPWPTALALQDRSDDVLVQLKTRLDSDVDLSQQLGDGQHGDDTEEELLWFMHADRFGLANPNRAIMDGEPSQHCITEAPHDSDAPVSSPRPSTRTSAGKAFPTKRKAETTQHHHHQEIAKLPRLFLGFTTRSSELSAAELVLDDDARRECAHIALHCGHAGQYKTRYYMEPEEKQWVSSIHDSYKRATNRVGSIAFFNRLYQWGVHTNALKPQCSPAGMQSFAKRGNGDEEIASAGSQVVPAKKTKGMGGVGEGGDDTADSSIEAATLLAMVRISEASTADELKSIVQEQVQSHSDTRSPPHIS